MSAERVRVLALLVGMAAAAPSARAQGELPDAEVGERLRFIDDRLQAGVAMSTAWQLGWCGVYGLGFVVEAGRAVLERDPSARADLVVSTSKAAIGTVARLVRPPHAMFGNRELRDLPSSTPDERRKKLVCAESLLRRNAHEADARYSWIGHSVNVGLNLAGGLIVWLGYHNLERAAESFSVGVIVGELAIWSQPWQPKRDLADYRARFGLARVPSATTARPTLSFAPILSPTRAGGLIAVQF